MKKILFTAVLTALVISCSNEEPMISVVPYPNSVEMKSGTFHAAGADFHMDPTMDELSKNHVWNFFSHLNSVSGKVGTCT